MIKNMIKTVVLAVVAFGLVFGTAQVSGQTNAAPPAAKAKKEKRKSHGYPFRGKVAKIDKMAKTLTVGKRTFQITSKTKITKDGKPAVLEDGTVGEPVTGYVVKSEGGELQAVTIHFGKPSSKPKEKAKQENNKPENDTPDNNNPPGNE